MCLKDLCVPQPNLDFFSCLWTKWTKAWDKSWASSGISVTEFPAPGPMEFQPEHDSSSLCLTSHLRHQEVSKLQFSAPKCDERVMRE